MQQWNSNAAYWQQSFAQSPGTGCVQAAQTYDYNHQGPSTTPSTTAATTSATPPPPGIDSKETVTTAVSAASTVSQAQAWSSYAATGMYPYPYQHQCAYGYGSYYPSYGPAPSNDPVQAAVRWNAAAYGYLAYPGAQAWSYPPPATAQVVNSPLTRQQGANGPRLTAQTTTEPTDTTENLQQPPATLQAKGTKEQWSEELKDYVQRAFLTVDTKEEKDQMERILKEKLEYIFRNNIKVDWATENIPTVPSKAIAALKNAALTRPSSVSVVKPVQLPMARTTRFTGPARGSSLRLPVGVISRGGRNMFTSKPATALPRKRSPFVKRPASPSSSEGSPEAPVRSSRRVFVHSRSRSRSRSSGRSSCSSIGIGGPQKRHRRPSPSPRRSSASKANNHFTSPVCSPTSSNDSTPRSGRYQQKSGRFFLGNDTSETKQPLSRNDNRGGRGRGRGGKQRKRGAGDNWGNSARLLSRADRFKDHLANNESTLTGSGSIARTTSQVLLNFMDDGRDDLTSEFGACQIVGTMEELEKPYLRLTRAPEPHEVRPLAVLKQSLEHVKQKWTEKSDYHWACEQFKSIRQDLTVQGIEDDFAVAVYEAHADAALDAGDFEEFHQCQSQLLRLYNEGASSTRVLEFTAYRLLYYIFTLDLLGINTIMAGLRPVHKSNPCIRFALDLRSAWSLHNYRRLFRFVCPTDEAAQPPLRCGRVIFWFLQRERKDALKTIFKVFRPHISLQYVVDLLGFPSVEECKQFLGEEFTVPEDLLVEDKVDCKLVWNAMCQGSQ